MKKLIVKYLFSFSFIAGLFSMNAQSLLTKLEKEYPTKPVNAIATFKTTRIGLGHSIETRKKGALEISLYSRYWNHKEGNTQRFLADEVSIRFGLDYAITDDFTIGAGYTNFNKVTDGFLKYKIIKQKRNTNKSPFSIVLFQGASIRKNKNATSGLYGSSTLDSNIYSFTSQVLIARKFNRKFSMQLTPTLINRNNSILEGQPKSQFALGFGARYKVGGHVSIVSEYFHVTNPVKSPIKTYNPFMVGVNWELSHLLLQFQITNARSFSEDTFITQTQNNFNFHDGNFHFGFNATFVLHLSKNKL